MDSSKKGCFLLCSMFFLALTMVLGGCLEGSSSGDTDNAGAEDKTESELVQINFEFSAQVQNAGGTGEDNIPVILQTEKWVWNSENEEYEIKSDAVFNTTLITRTEWSGLIPYPGFTDIFKVGYRIGKVGYSHPSYVTLHATIEGFPATYMMVKFTHSDALGAGDNATVKQIITLLHPEL
jgi:hypothetical protein